MTSTACPFCQPQALRIVHAAQLVLAIRDAFPVTEGHTLVLPKRHIPSWLDATPAERSALLETVDLVRAELTQEFSPAGFNIGFNEGEAAGQTIPHLHLHVIPRYPGDTPDPTGGIRKVIPSKGNYISPPLGGASIVADSTNWCYDDPTPVPHRRSIIAGGEDPLIAHLLPLLLDAEHADIAVAFITQSGFELLRPHLLDLLDRRGQLRILTGDYLGFTDPDALRRLIDLQEDHRDRVELRVYECRDDTFHPKVYILKGGPSGGVAVVGSSNLTHAALSVGAVEWNQRTIHARDSAAFRDVEANFEHLFTEHPQSTPLTDDWIAAYRKRRTPPGAAPAPPGTDPPIDSPAPPEGEPLPPVSPHGVQEEALAALAATRSAGNAAGLVVLATGLGKTWLSAFDTQAADAKRVLFVAHRQEILTQARDTFRRIRPEAHLGFYTGTEKAPRADVLFASIQTLGKKPHLLKFAPNAFDYIIVDEFHHAAAASYKKLLRHFQPAFMLGLTATPERTDGGDLLALCEMNLVFRCDLNEGINRLLLSPFHYFGVPDVVDYENIPWRSARFDPEELTNKLASEARAQNALEQYRDKAGQRTLAFCCSVRHAEYMRDFFRAAGIPCAAVHSQPSSDGRESSLTQLAEGSIRVLFAIDIFNEGVDLPLIDTVMMLRPTESKILWLQQLGRGLRKAKDKTHLCVIDYIGNHRTFLNRPQIIYGLPPGDVYIRNLLKDLPAKDLELPAGCRVTYDLESINILNSLLRSPKKNEVLTAYYTDYQERHSRRPTAAQTYRDGYNPRTARTSFGSWLDFVNSQGGLTPEQVAAFSSSPAKSLLTAIERLDINKSFELITLITLIAALNLDNLPGSTPIDTLAAEVLRVTSRRDALTQEFGQHKSPPRDIKTLLTEWPIAHLVGNAKTGPFCRYVDDHFHIDLPLPSAQRLAFQELARELLDWRIAVYLDPANLQTSALIPPITCKVSHNKSNPILFLQPGRDKRTDIPTGPTPVRVDGQTLIAEFKKIAVNVIHAPDQTKNLLPEILHQMFGPDAGKPGTQFIAQFRQAGGEWVIEAQEQASQQDSLTLWQSYMRAEIPPLFGLTFSSGSWNQGFISKDNQIFLLVTLKKDDMPSDHQYPDHFIDRSTFEWKSQNRHTQASPTGQAIRNHQSTNTPVHLFIRPTKKTQAGRAAPFTYCGQTTFKQWEGEKPITIQWNLIHEVPSGIWRIMHP